MAVFVSSKWVNFNGTINNWANKNGKFDNIVEKPSFGNFWELNKYEQKVTTILFQKNDKNIWKNIQKKDNIEQKIKISFVSKIFFLK